MQRIPVHLVICGSHEAVAEVVMAMRQPLDMQVERNYYGTARPVVQLYGVGTMLKVLSTQPFEDSTAEADEFSGTTIEARELSMYGIEDLDSYSRFTASFLIAENAVDPLAVALERAHPHVAVTIAADDPLQSAHTRANGRVTRFRVPPWPDAQAARGKLSRSHLDRIHEYVAPVVAELHAKSCPATSGWPRWSLAAHAANAAGVAGLRLAVAAAGTTVDEMVDILRSETRAARATGTASWVDTLMFGEPARRRPTRRSRTPVACVRRGRHGRENYWPTSQRTSPRAQSITPLRVHWRRLWATPKRVYSTDCTRSLSCTLATAPD